MNRSDAPWVPPRLWPALMGWASAMPGLARQPRNQAIVAAWLTRLTRSGARGPEQTTYMTVAVRLRTGSARHRAPDWVAYDGTTGSRRRSPCVAAGAEGPAGAEGAGGRGR